MPPDWFVDIDWKELMRFKSSFTQPVPKSREESFKKADTLIEEVDISEPGETARVQRWIIEHGGYPNGDAITDHLSEVTSSHLAAYVKRGGLSEPAIARFRPWVVSVLVVQLELKRMGFYPVNGVDLHFLDEARQSHKLTAGQVQQDLARCPFRGLHT